MKTMSISRYDNSSISNGAENKRLLEIIKKIGKCRVLVIGDLMLDEFLGGKIERISPEAPVPIVKIKNGQRKLSLGGAANVAYNIKALGGNPFLVGVIGDDSQAKDFLKLMRNCGLSTSGIITENKRPTTHKLRVIAHFQQVIRLDRETNEEISSESNKKITEYITKCIPKTDPIRNKSQNNIKRISNGVNCVVISDYAKGLLNRKLLSKILSMFKTSKIPVLVDPTLKNIEDYSGATLIKPNLKEALQILAKADDTPKREIVHELRERLGIKNILLTCGEQGMTLLEKETLSEIPSLGKEIHDVTGAGDTVIATVALALSANASLKEAAILSNFTAGIVVGKLGTAGVTQKELLEIINQRKDG